jgi:hypothetical protein
MEKISRRKVVGEVDSKRREKSHAASFLLLA